MYAMGMFGRPKGDSRLFFWFLATQLSAFAWRATWDFSTEVFSMSKHSAERLLVQTVTSIQGQATLNALDQVEDTPQHCQIN